MKHFKFIVVLLFVVFGSISRVNAQNPIVVDGYTILPITVIDGDTLPHALIPQIVVFPTRKFANKRDYRQYQRLIRNLKIVYPYAIIAKMKISEMDAHFSSLNTDLERKAYAKQVEKELRNEFEGQLVELTITQGRLLIKLIDREVGRTSYDIIKEMRGGVTAVFWQAVARIFGSNLKTQFDSVHEDKLLNELIILHEHGLL
jgi:hypothetical protein